VAATGLIVGASTVCATLGVEPAGAPAVAASDTDGDPEPDPDVAVVADPDVAVVADEPADVVAPAPVVPELHPAIAPAASNDARIGPDRPGESMPACWHVRPVAVPLFAGADQSDRK
jgi:hypothetical protein